MALTDSQSDANILQATLPVHVELAGTVVTGDVIGYSSGWKRALGTAGSTVHGLLIALEPGESGDTIQAARGVVIDGRFSGGTAGAVLYVAEGSDNGKYTETLPTTQNDITTPVGFMLSETAAVLWPESGPRTLDPS